MLVASCLYTVVCYISYGSKIPFTKPYDEIGDAQGWTVLVLFIPVAILAGIHYFMATQISYGTIIYLAVLMIVNIAVWKIVFKRRK